MHVHDLVPFPDKNFDLSHTITKLTFGQGYPGQQNPLDGVLINQTTSTASQAATGMWQYFLKVSQSMLTYVVLFVYPAYEHIHMLKSLWQPNVAMLC